MLDMDENTPATPENGASETPNSAKRNGQYGAESITVLKGLDAV